MTSPTNDRRETPQPTPEDFQKAESIVENDGDIKSRGCHGNLVEEIAKSLMEYSLKAKAEQKEKDAKIALSIDSDNGRYYGGMIAAAIRGSGEEE